MLEEMKKLYILLQYMPELYDNINMYVLVDPPLLVMFISLSI